MDAAPPSVDISELDECFRCGYGLRGIVNDQPCPECGLLAERSRRVTDELHDTRPGWLRSLSRGVWLILLSFVILIGWQFGYALSIRWLYQYLYGPAAGTWMLTMADLIPSLGFFVGGILIFVGVFLLTRPEGFAQADQADALRRRCLRLRRAAFLGHAHLPHAASRGQSMALAGVYRGTTSPSALVRSRRYHWICFPDSSFSRRLSISLLFFFQLRNLAKRARSAHLAEHCAIVGIGTTLALIVSIAIHWMLQAAEDHRYGTYWLERSTTALLLMLTAGLLASLAFVWSFYLMLRFAIAFHRAGRKLDDRWKRADRSIAERR